MYEPKIFAFLCNWCSYAGADLAGVSRLQYPPNIRIIRVMCSGRIDPYFLVEALRIGADGVLVTGCHPADCHYISGNYNAIYKILFTQKLIEKIGINSARVSLEWISASESEKFRNTIINYTEQITKLGPIRANHTERIDLDLKLLQEICVDFNFRWVIGKSRDLIELGNVYEEKIEKERYIAIIDKIIDSEIIRKRILTLLKEKPLTAIDIAKKLSISNNLIMQHLIALKTKQKVQLQMVDHDAMFAIIES